MGHNSLPNLSFKTDNYFIAYFFSFQDLSPELAAMLLAAVIGGYTLIGGLGATFYVSYFNTALIFVLIIMLVVEVFYNPYNNPDNPFGNATRLYEFISCWKAPNGNRDESYLTFFSPGKYYCFDLILNGILLPKLF